MGAHSIGPWSVVKKYNGTVVIAAHGGLVASMEAGSQSMRDANASLIAVAPDLLEACKAARDTLDRLMGDTDLDDDTSLEMRTFKMLNVAIAKAEGK